MRKQRIKPHFFGLRVEDYKRLVELGMTHAALNILKHSPARFFRDFSRHTKTVADEFKSELYMLTFQITTQPDRNRIETKTRKEGVAA